MFDCDGCNESFKCGNKVSGFPFELDKKLGSGGYAMVYKGRFHQNDAAFKFIPLQEGNFNYVLSDVGCWEYNIQEMIIIKQLLFTLINCIKIIAKDKRQ